MSVYDSPKTSTMATGTNTPPVDRSLGELFGDLMRDTSTLVRQEVQLAKNEMMAKATKVGKDVGMIAAGGFVAYIGVLVLAAALVLVLANLMPTWLAALLVGAVFVVGGGLVVMQGMAALKRVDPVPHQTVETLKEDAQWLKAQK